MMGALQKRERTNLHAVYRRFSRVPISKNRKTLAILPVLPKAIAGTAKVVERQREIGDFHA